MRMFLVRFVPCPNTAASCVAARGKAFVPGSPGRSSCAAEAHTGLWRTSASARLASASRA
eukprot:CAMPEP_0195599440 /NCGR_PEP_ID=MMETSP0815-20121206/4035_1 /TAXON_ID=97485 /ORGANISM="Prymnesium parvum, Strain Texoma1" /LENGTH=59 /DNA_ID=CAMNT_0040738879 /DNA_START=171 /DNA_END=347 /DNA_ORIENTATION=-